MPFISYSFASHSIGVAVRIVAVTAALLASLVLAPPAGATTEAPSATGSSEIAPPETSSPGLAGAGGSAVASSSVLALDHRSRVVLREINQVRRAHGLRPLSGRTGTCQRTWARSLARHGAFRHGTCDSILAKGNRIDRFGEAWNASGPHRRLILRAKSHAYIGVATTRGGNTIAVVYLR